MKILTVLLVLSLANFSSTFACTVCKANQPKVLQGIAHGIGPNSNWDYLIVVIMVAIVVGTFMLSIRHLIKPGEASDNHIKRSILNIDIYE